MSPAYTEIPADDQPKTKKPFDVISVHSFIILI